jgi:hypothetical protein
MRTARRVLVCGMVLLTFSTLSCGPARRHTEPATMPPLPAEMPLAALGQLPVFLTDQTSDGRNIKLRGLVGNPYPDSINGVRVIFRMLAAPDEAARELDRFQKVMEVQLGPGARTPISWDIQTMYAGLAGRSGFTLQAFAIRRGDQMLPLPPDWKD